MLLILLVACDFKNDGDLEMPSCEDTSTDVAMDEVTPLGFAAEEVVPFADGDHAISFTWDQGADVDGLIGVALSGGSARYVDSEAVYPEGEETPAIGIECPDRVEIDAALTLSTSDGGLAEAWNVTLYAVDALAMAFSVQIPDAAFTGSYVLADHVDTADSDELTASASGRFDATGATGEVMGQASGQDECADGDECSAWATQVPVGTWASPVVE